MRPASLVYTPASSFIIVDLPAPFSPSKACTSPGRKSKRPSLIAWTPGKLFSIPSIKTKPSLSLVTSSFMWFPYVSRINPVINPKYLACPDQFLNIVAIYAVDVVAGVRVNERVGRHSQAGESVGPLGRGGGGFALGYVGRQLDELGG